MTDQHLLRDYAKHGSDAAFAELVRRHVDLVYSAALRMVCEAHSAQDITQAVFVALAQNASRLTNHPVISGWLHCTARNLAAKAVRSDVRRRAREQEAIAMNELLSSEPDAIWKQIAPHLDAGLGELSDSDRDTITLRFFERKSAREMAQRLSISEDAAQKRVNRAVDRLREFFSRRGIAVGASGLAVLISANAVQAAPVGLAITISIAASVVGTTLATPTTAITKTIAMTALQKALIAASLVAAIGTAIYEAHQAATLRAQISTLQKQQTEQIQQLTSERDAAFSASANKDELERLRKNQNELLRLRGEVGMLRQQTNELGKLREISQRLPQTPPPEAQTPEQIAALVTHKQFCAQAWMRAFIAYAKKNQGQLPASFEQAEPYWPQEVGGWSDVPANQFEILYHGSLDSLTNLDVIVFREKKLWQHVNGRWGRFDVLANGNTQYGSVPDGSGDNYFSDYETEHTAPANGQ